MKMRSGYVSNSSSSSFILKDVKDVPRAIDLYKEFVDGYDIAGWFDGYKELPRKPRMLASGMNWQNNLKNT